MVSILVVGLDQDLLSTRALVLCQASPQVQCATPEEALRLLRLGPIPIVVLCHTLMDQHPTLCRQIHAIAPASLILLLQVEESRGSPDCGEFTLVPRPEALVQAVRNLLETHSKTNPAAVAQASRPRAPGQSAPPPHIPSASFL